MHRGTGRLRRQQPLHDRHLRPDNGLRAAPIPPDDAAALQARGVAAVFTPKDYRLTDMMDVIVTLVREAQELNDHVA